MLDELLPDIETDTTSTALATHKPGSRTAITVAHGDGIGPEIMGACLKVLHAAKARIDIDEITVGEASYLDGHSSGIGPGAWESIRKSRVLFKGPITTPQGGGYKSLNVTIRKSLGLFANVRPCVSYAPFVETLHPGMDVTIIRENEEDLYAGIEHRQTDDVYQCLKLITRPGCEKIARYAFEYARAHGRSKVSCFTKDNIMKLTDGLFHKVFDEVAADYSDIEAEHLIVDIGAARLADTPGRFDVVVMPNLYGDILSDVAAQITGSVGLGPSANIGDHCAMFEAIHGSAPDLAGQNVANPSGLLLASVMMLNHIGQGDVATLIHNAWLKTIEDGVHTPDLARSAKAAKPVATDAFADAVIERLGDAPTKLSPITEQANRGITIAPSLRKPKASKELVGMDVFVHSRASVYDIAFALRKANTASLELKMITNRGVVVWPKGVEETFHTDHWRCRFEASDGAEIAKGDLIDLLARIDEVGLDFIKTEQLFTFDGEPGYSLGQGQ